jgi:predicted dithiol-disulfide oxidoreductase (DUF899 family)
MTTPSESNHHPGETPPVVEAAAWQTARDELMAREKAHMREGDAISAARRRLPMVEVDGTAEVVGFNGPVAFIDLFQGRDVLLVHKHMWHDGIPIEGQCMGCTINTWHIQRSAVYLRARGVSLAVLTTGRWEEVAPFVEFMGYTEPWYSAHGLPWPLGEDMGPVACFLRVGEKVFLTYATVSRGTEVASGVFALLDMTPYGRGEKWEESPAGRPEGHDACWFWRTDADGVPTWGPTGRPVAQWTRPGATPVADGPGNVE